MKVKAFSASATPVSIPSSNRTCRPGSCQPPGQPGDEQSKVFFLHGDHLGSVSLTTDQAGAAVSQARSLPFGGEYWVQGAAKTDFGFTGQRKEAGFGLMDYHARYYSPKLGRFISPDTIVPDPTNPKDLDRYSYVRNNPLHAT